MCAKNTQDSLQRASSMWKTGITFHVIEADEGFSVVNSAHNFAIFISPSFGFCKILLNHLKTSRQSSLKHHCMHSKLSSSSSYAYATE